MDEFRTTRGYELESHRELTPAMEDYLEMLYRLCLEEGYARTGTLSHRLQVRPSSASKMTGKLRQLGYIANDGRGGLVLTDKGRSVAEYLLYRHETVAAFLDFLGSRDTLRETELLEHMVGKDTVGRLRRLLDFARERPDFLRDWQNTRDRGK